MKTIWKFPLDVTDVQHVVMPAGARVLPDVAAAGGSLLTPLFIWAEVDTDDELTERTFFVLGTGNPSPVSKLHAEYVGSCLKGSFVWHVYEGS